MSSISSSFVPTGGTTDSVQDLEGFQYSVATGSASLLTAAPATQAANAFQLVNKSDCPLKVTLTLQGPTPKGGTAPAPVEKEVVACPGEILNLSFSADVITSADIEQAGVAPANALTADTAIPVVANADQDLSAAVRFFNS